MLARLKEVIWCGDNIDQMLLEVLRLEQCMLQVREAELPIAKRLLGHLVEEGSSLKAEDQEDVRLEGKLRLMLELVQGLDCRSVGRANNGNMVLRIIVGELTGPSCAPGSQPLWHVMRTSPDLRYSQKATGRGCRREHCM